MKRICFVLVLCVIFTYAQNSSAKSHSNLDEPDVQLVQPEKFSIEFAGLADRESLENLLQKLDDPDPFVRVEAVQALGEIWKQESVILACDCLSDENIYVRAYAAETLGKIGRVDIGFVLSRLIPALDDPSPYVRAMMVAALGELQDARAAGSVRKLLSDDDESVRKMAAWALSNIEQTM